MSLRRPSGRGLGRGERRISVRVPEPHRRDRGLPRAGPRAHPVIARIQLGYLERWLDKLEMKLEVSRGPGRTGGSVSTRCSALARSSAPSSSASRPGCDPGQGVAGGEFSFGARFTEAQRCGAAAGAAPCPGRHQAHQPAGTPGTAGGVAQGLGGLSRPCWVSYCRSSWWRRSPALRCGRGPGCPRSWRTAAVTGSFGLEPV